MPDVHAYYLRDFGTQLRADAIEAGRNQAGGGEFAQGQAIAYSSDSTG